MYCPPRHHYYYYYDYGHNLRSMQSSDENNNNNKSGPSFLAYMRIVRWLYEAVGPNDPRGFEPRPMFSFAAQYNLLAKDPAEIYRRYVAYQCHVYSEAAKHVNSDTLNNSTFGDIQKWYEQKQNEDTNYFVDWEIL